MTPTTGRSTVQLRSGSVLGGTLLIAGSCIGAGMLALLMFLFNVWACRVFAAKDKAWAADPRNAKLLGSSTSDALSEHDCECMRSRF